MDTKYIFVTGGVVSSIGKGIASASLGTLLSKCGYRVTPIKIDPYLNVDCGTMNPIQHGEVFVTNDGTETDLDLGHYERFLNQDLTNQSSITAGKIYQEIVQKERNGDFLGQTVQVIPHVTDLIKQKILKCASDSRADIVLIELGGTVGDIESLPFIEAIRQLRNDVSSHNVLYVHVTLLPSVGPWNELKTKPTQHSVIRLRELGISPDILICRSSVRIPKDAREKLSLFCGVPLNAIIESTDAKTVYQIPIDYHKIGLDKLVLSRLGLDDKKPNLDSWSCLVHKICHPTSTVDIAFVGKYLKNGDSYKSIEEALVHAGAHFGCKVNLHYIDSEHIHDGTERDLLPSMEGIIVGPGFGDRGHEGKIAAVKYAREQKIPFLGICLGMQTAVIEYVRHVCGHLDADSTEMNPETSHPVIRILAEQERILAKGATMRLGIQECFVIARTLAFDLYEAQFSRSPFIHERHRHRYEVSPAYQQILRDAGLVISGINIANHSLVEMIELPREVHPFFIGTQAHPEFKSRLEDPHPLFLGFINAVRAVQFL